MAKVLSSRFYRGLLAAAGWKNVRYLSFFSSLLHLFRSDKGAGQVSDDIYNLFALKRALT